jgi:hypothetical protein
LVLLLHDDSQFNQEESEMMVATRNLGLCTTPLREVRQIVDFGERGVPGTMFPPEVLVTTEDQINQQKYQGVENFNPRKIPI